MLPSSHLLREDILIRSCTNRTEETIAVVQAAVEEDVNKAVNAAHAALKHPSWKLLPASDRGVLMNRLADLIEQHRELFATIDAWDNGKTRQLALSDWN